MKKFFVIPVLIALLSGCSDERTDSLLLPDNFQGKILSESNNVSYNSIISLEKAQRHNSRNSFDAESEISCIADKNNDTLLYLCNNEFHGWKIMSSDTRISPVIAHSDKGNIQDLLQNEAMMSWIYTIAQDIKQVKQASDDELLLSPQEIEANKNFWASIENPDAFAKKMALSNPKSRATDLKVIPPPELCGHYELSKSETTMERVDEHPHLLSTQWHQGYPFNNCVPYATSNYVGRRVPAGCVAIAAAQIMYYLHYHIGKPETAPSAGYCNSTYYETPRDWSQYNYTNSVWDDMSESSIATAPLIADIGRRVDMNYAPNGSGAQVNILPQRVFLPYGIKCSYGEYDHLKVAKNLYNGIPVLLAAVSSSKKHHNPDINIKDGAHAFIADSYCRERTITKNTYVWIYDHYPTNPDGTLVRVPDFPDKIEYTYSSPYISHIGMNWGYGPDYQNDNEWFLLTGGCWLKEVSSNLYNDWDINRCMVYDFSEAY